MLECERGRPTTFTSQYDTNEDFDGILTSFKSDNDIMMILMKEDLTNGQETKRSGTGN